MQLMTRTPKPYKKPDAAEVKKRWQACVDDMLAIRRNFWLNESFFHGEQWVGYNDQIHELTTLDFRSQDDATARTTVNKIKPRTVQFEARMLRTPLEFEPRPEGVDAEDMRRARIAQQLLQVEAHRRDWEQVRADEVHNTMLGGVAAVCIEPSWEYRNMPVPDSTTGDLIRVPDRPAPKFTALSAVEFGIEPGSRSVQDARWWIRQTTLTPKQAKDYYRLDAEPTPDSQTATGATHRALMKSRRADKKSDVCSVYVLYERPCADSPGCVVHVVGDKVVQESEWPFPWDDEPNIVVFWQTKMSSTWKGDTIVNDARSLQMTLNRLHTSINNNIGKTDNARMLIPNGSVIDEDDEITGDAGEIIRYNAEGGGAPSWMSPPQVARWLTGHMDVVTNELDDAFSAHAVSRGQAPGDRNSGLALSILAEKDETPLGIMAGNQQRGWQRLAEWHLQLMRHLLTTAERQPNSPLAGKRYTDVLDGVGGAPPQKVEWSAADIAESPIVHVPLESVMPRSQAAVQQQMLTLAQAFPQMFQGLGPAELAVVLQTPDPSAFTRQVNYHVGLAEWENGRMVVGSQDNEVEIAEWHDHDIHVQAHNKLRASAAYRGASQDVRNYIDLHVDAHAKLAQEQMQQQQMMQQMAMQQQVPPGESPDGEEEAPATEEPQQ